MIIAQVHLTQEKEKILQLGRQSSIEYEGNWILIFTDNTDEMLQLLREIQHSLRFPARLHIHYQGQVKTLNHADEAKTLVNQKLWMFTFLNIDEESLNVFWVEFYHCGFCF